MSETKTSYTIEVKIYLLPEPDSVNMRERIGSTVYEVCLHFDPTAKETINDKILRLVRNDLRTAPQDGNMALPQTSRLPERGSL